MKLQRECDEEAVGGWVVLMLKVKLEASESYLAFLIL